MLNSCFIKLKKSSHQRFSMKKLFLKIFAILLGKHLFWRKSRRAASELTLWSHCLEFCLWMAFKTILTQYYYNISCFQTKALNKIWHICLLMFCNVLLYGGPQFDDSQNTYILNLSIKYILISERFSGCLF